MEVVSVAGDIVTDRKYCVREHFGARALAQIVI